MLFFSVILRVVVFTQVFFSLLTLYILLVGLGVFSRFEKLMPVARAPGVFIPQRIAHLFPATAAATLRSHGRTHCVNAVLRILTQQQVDASGRVGTGRGNCNTLLLLYLLLPWLKR